MSRALVKPVPVLSEMHAGAGFRGGRMIAKTSLVLILALFGFLTSSAKKSETPSGGRAISPNQSFALPGPVLKTNGETYQESNFDLDSLTYHYTMPPDRPTPPGDKYDVGLNGNVSAGAPQISEFTRQASADRSFILQGAKFASGNGTNESDTRLWIYSQTTTDNGTLSSVSLLQGNDAAVTGLIAPTEPYGMYLVWALNAEGASYPVRINATEAWWIGPNHATIGASVSVYGRNLSANNGEVSSYVYIRPWGAGSDTPSISCSVTSVNPYKVTFTVPALTSNAYYEVWIHNGHGGDYGWSGPLRVYVEASDPYTWNGTTRSVMSYGAIPNDSLDDSSAIQSAIDASSDGDIVLFPAGTFLVSTMLQVNNAISFEGAGSTATTINIPRSSFCCQAVLKINDLPTRVRNIGFMSAITNGARSGVIFFDGHKQTPTKAGAIVDSIRVTTPNAASSFYPCVATRSINDIRATNSTFVASRAFSLYLTFQAFIHNNTIDGNWPANDTSSGTEAIGAQASNEIDVSGNLARSLDRASGNTMCRLLVAQGHGHGLTSHHYVANNETQDTGCAVGTCGEQILFEAPGTFFTGRAYHVGADTVTFPGVWWKTNYFAADDRTRFTDYDEQRPAVIFIQSGQGEGQYRRILSNTFDTVTLDRPWDIEPNTSSVFTIITTSYRSIVYKNRLNGFAGVFGNPYFSNVGIVTFGSQFDMVAAGNVINNLRVGIEISSLTHYSCVCKIAGRAIVQAIIVRAGEF
jgi:Pectate lyase superfamily protein